MVILLYHHISSPSPLAKVRGLYTSPHQFNWQISWLIDHGYQFTTFEKLETSPPLTPAVKTTILTFDDGSESVFLNAFPLVEKLGIPAVLFPVSALIAQKEATIPSNFDPAPHAYQSPEQIKVMAEAGWEIGSHLQTHTPVTELSDEALLSELTESKKNLETITGKEVVSLAYPYGIYDARTINMALDCGYKYGVTTNPASVGEDPKMELPRLAVKGAAWYHRYYFLRNLKRYGG